MQNQFNESVNSIGCAICTLNFTSKDDENVVTTCGHLYHKSCLTKWFSSAQELNGHSSCPDCRTYLNGKNGIKTVYLRFMSDESSNANITELIRVQSENERLVEQISKNEYAMKKMALELKTERSKNTRLMNKVGVLSAKLKEIDTPSKNAATKVFKGQVVTKVLRNRQCTYKI